MEMGVGVEYVTTCLRILDIPGGRSSIVQHVLKVMDNKIGPIIQDMSYKPNNQNSEGGVLLKLEHNFDLWYKLTEYERIKRKRTIN